MVKNGTCTNGENQEVVDPNAGAATDEANNGTPTNGENQEVQQAE